jgi:hypothetical protein
VLEHGVLGSAYLLLLKAKYFIQSALQDNVFKLPWVASSTAQHAVVADDRVLCLSCKVAMRSAAQLETI